MGQRDTADTDTATARLHQLAAYYRQHPVTGPEGHSYTRFGSRTPAANPGLPFRPEIVEHIDAAVTEVVTHTRAVNPDAGPLPDHVAGVYEWARQHTEHAPDAERQARDTREIRHRLEHAVAAGDTSVVRPHRCPACQTLGGLFWDDRIQRARCVNRHCAKDNRGIHRTWTLARLASEQAAVEKTLRECAT
jgi:hypothetical protein